MIKILINFLIKNWSADWKSRPALGKTPYAGVFLAGWIEFFNSIPRGKFPF